MFDNKLQPILEALDKIKHVVILLSHKRKILLGLSKHNDFRMDKWTFIGGSIKSNENPFQAALREAKEECGLDIKFSNESKIVGNVMFMLATPRYSSLKLKHNSEFKAMGFFDKASIKSLKLAPKVLETIKEFNVF